MLMGNIECLDDTVSEYDMHAYELVKALETRYDLSEGERGTLHTLLLIKGATCYMIHTESGMNVESGS